MVSEWIRMVGSLVVALLVGLTVWVALAWPRRLTWLLPSPVDPSIKASESPGSPDAMEPWLVLLPAHWMRWGLRRMQWLTGFFLGAITAAITWNPAATLAFGWIGFWLPEIILRDMAWVRWTALDRAAYTLVYSSRFYLEQGTPVLQTWRTLAPQAQPVFQRWIEPCLLGETQGIAFDQALKQQALAIRHAELAVTADILAVERKHGQTLGILGQLLTMWGKRIELDADRRGSLTGFVWIGRATLIVGIALFWSLVLGDVAVRAHMHTLPGEIMIGLSAVLLAAATTLYYRHNRGAEQF